MRICGCEISAQEVRLAVVELNGERNVEFIRIKTTRIELKDDTSEEDLRSQPMCLPSVFAWFG